MLPCSALFVFQLFTFKSHIFKILLGCSCLDRMLGSDGQVYRGFICFDFTSEGGGLHSRAEAKGAVPSDVIFSPVFILGSVSASGSCATSTIGPSSLLDSSPISCCPSPSSCCSWGPQPMRVPLVVRSSVGGCLSLSLRGAHDFHKSVGRASSLNSGVFP